jgi:hypothetical protein
MKMAAAFELPRAMPCAVDVVRTLTGETVAADPLATVVTETSAAGVDGMG